MLGLGKTIEAIGLTLLHRHPLSTRRENIHEDVGDADQEEEKRPVPTIDFIKGIPDSHELNVLNWIDAERQAFEGRVLWDEESKLNVSEVAVGTIH